jgi:hypothetical protein
VASSGSFTAFIAAYDSIGNVLGTFTEDGLYNEDNDNSAIFIGVADTTSEIAKVSFGDEVEPKGSEMRTLISNAAGQDRLGGDRS